METGGQIGIELRLLMDKLKGDIANAAKAIKKDLSGPVTGDMTGKADEGMEKTGKEADKLATRINRVSEAARVLKQRLADIASGKLSPVQPGMTVRGAGEESEAASRQARLEELRRYRAQGLRGYNVQDFFRGGQYGRRNPNLATVLPPSLGGTAKLEMTRFQELQSIGKAIALNAAAFTAALASLRVAVGLVKYAFSGLLQPLNMLQRSMEEARSRYAASLTSGGLPLGFTSRRSVLASVIGVGEGEVLKYAGAVKQLNEMVAISSKVHAETAQSLAMGAWKVRAFKEDWKAMLENVTYLYTPALNRITTWLDEILKTFIARQNDARKAADEAWAKEKAVLQERQKALQEQIKAGAFGSVRFGQERHDKIARMKAEGELKQITDKLKAHEIANAPEASAHRLRSSPWEQMGMVIGLGAAENPMKQTAKNTAKSAEYLGQMAAAFGLNRGVARTGSMSLYPINLP
jgi:hypothetical protein